MNTMKPLIPRVIPVAILSLCSFLAVAGRSAVAQTTWTGSGGNLSWTTTGNWSDSASPEGKIVTFGTAGSVASVATINNIVNGNFTIPTLRLGSLNSTINHSMQINSGNTLIVAGDMQVGSTALSGTGQANANLSVTRLQVSGPGTLQLGTTGTATDLFIGSGTTTSGATAVNPVGFLTFDSSSGKPKLDARNLREVRIAQSGAAAIGSVVRGVLDLRNVDVVSGTLSMQHLRMSEVNHVWSSGLLMLDQTTGLNTLQVTGSANLGFGRNQANATARIGDPNNGWKLPTNLNLIFGTGTAARGTLAMATGNDESSGNTVTSSIIASSGGSFTGFLTDMRLGGLGVGQTGTDSRLLQARTATLDLRGMNSVNLDVSGTLALSGVFSAVRLPSGTATVGQVALGESFRISRSLLELNNTTMTVSGTVDLFSSTLALNGGTLGARAIRQNGTLSWSGGTIRNNSGSNLTMDSGVSVNLSTQSGTFDASAGQSITVSSTISGLGGFTKAGSGSLILNAANTFSGVTSLTSGSLVIANANALQNSTLDRSVSTGTLVFNQDSTLGGLSGSQNVDAQGRSLAIGNNNSITTFSGGLSTPTLTKVGSGVLLLAGANTMTSATVSAGGLGYGRRTSAPSGSTTVAAGATIGLGVSASDTTTYYSASDIDALFSGTFSGVSNTAGVSNVGIDTSPGDFTYASNITGSRGLAKFGTNTLTLTGNNTFSGGIQVAGGRLVPQTAGAVGTGAVTIASGTFDINSLTLNNTFAVVGGALTGGTVGASQLSQTSGGRISAVMNGAGGLTKTGTGTLIVAGGNTFTGATRIEAGTLAVVPGGLLNASSGVTLAATNGAAAPVLMFDNVGAVAATSQSVGPLVFDSGAGTVAVVRSADQNLAVTLGSLTRTAGAVGNFVPGGGTNSATNGFSISGRAAGFINTGVYYSGTSFAWYDAGGFVRGINYGTDAGTATVASGTTVSSTTHLLVTGSGVSAQSTATFTTIAFTGAVNNFSVADSATVTVQGLLLSGTGSTTLGPVLALGAAADTPANYGVIRSASNADLDVRVDLNSTLTISSRILANGTNGLTKSGSGTLVLSPQFVRNNLSLTTGTSTFTGLTRPLEGTLRVNGQALAFSTLDMSAATSGTVIFEQDSRPNSGVVLLGGLTGSRDLDFGTRAITIGNNGASSTYSGILSSGTLTKTGTGTLTLTGSSTLAGVTSINQGTIAIDRLSNSGQASPLGTSGTINLGSGTNGGTLRYAGSGDSSNRTIAITGSSGGIVNASGAGALNMSTGTISTSISNNVVTLTGTSTADNAIGVIAATGGATGVGVDKTDSGRWWLTGNSSYNGQLRVLDGTLVVGATVASSGASPFGSAVLDNLLPTIGSSALGAMGTASLLVAAGNSIERGFSVAALGGGGASQVVVLGATGTGSAQIGTAGTEIRLNRSAITLQASNSGTAVFAGNWRDGSGNANPTVAYTIGALGNAGVVVLESEFSSSATSVNIVNGTARLQAGANNRINSATPVTVGSGLGAAILDINGQSQLLSSTLTFTGNSGSITGGTLRLGGATAVAVSGTGHVISSLVALDADKTFNVASASRLGITSAISGSFGLTKTGAGILELAGLNSYTGNTTVSAGTLVVNGGLAGGALSVAAGATLMGSGTVGGAATIEGIHSPGNSPGIETFASNLTYSGGSSQVVWELWGNTIDNSPLAYDQIVVNGDLAFSGSTSLTLSFGGPGTGSVDWDDVFWASPQKWTLFDVLGTTSNFGNFTLTQSPNSWFDASGQAFGSSIRSENSFSVAQSGTDIVINYTIVVPEPGALALAGIGIAAAAYAARSRSPSRKRAG